MTNGQISTFDALRKEYLKELAALRARYMQKFYEVLTGKC